MREPAGVVTKVRELEVELDIKSPMKNLLGTAPPDMYILSDLEVIVNKKIKGLRTKNVRYLNGLIFIM
tara:strand:- start:251 stop:454 length:204 start_codon:yes stop_codon:yes gene_type:complete